MTGLLCGVPMSHAFGIVVPHLAHLRSSTACSSQNGQTDFTIQNAERRVFATARQGFG